MIALDEHTSRVLERAAVEGVEVDAGGLELLAAIADLRTKLARKGVDLDEWLRAVYLDALAFARADRESMLEQYAKVAAVTQTLASHMCLAAVRRALRETAEAAN